MSVSCLVFSRDRAMQLDALLRSIERHCPERYASIDVLYLVTNKRHEQAYEQLEREHDGAYLWAEWSDFEGHVLDWVAAVKTGELAFHTDDDVFFASVEPLLPLHRDVLCWSPRLGLNTTFCHPLQREQKAYGGRFEWRVDEWPGPSPDFEYPMSLDGHVYRSADVKAILERAGGFDDPTSFEAALHAAAYADDFTRERRPLMECGTRSSMVSVPANVVSARSGNPRGARPTEQPAALLRMFLQGYRIDLDAMSFADVRGAHQLVPLQFKRRG